MRSGTVNQRGSSRKAAPHAGRHFGGYAGTARTTRTPKQLDAGIFQAEISSFALRLAAEGKAAKTIRTYTEAVQWFAAACPPDHAGRRQPRSVDPDSASWSSTPDDTDAIRLEIQDDANAVIYGPSGALCSQTGPVRVQPDHDPAHTRPSCL